MTESAPPNVPDTAPAAPPAALSLGTPNLGAPAEAAPPGDAGDARAAAAARSDDVAAGPSPGPVEGTPVDRGPEGGSHEGESHEGPGGERRRRRRRRRGKGRPETDQGDHAGPADRPPQSQQGQQSQQSHRHGRPYQHGQYPYGSYQHGHGRNTEHHALHALKALSRMAQALLRVEGVDPLSAPRFLDLQLRVPLDEHADVARAAGTAVEQILQRVREVREHERALKPGAVFCYFTGSADADHCRPAEPRQVFEGYNTTGKPVFADFVTMAIERKDPGIDQLLAGDDMVLTHVTMGRVLRTQQLAEFGGNSPVFKILGQVDAGLFRVLGAEQKCAFSFQLLRGTTLEGKPRLRLHAVGRVDLMDLADPAVLNILSRFQRHLDTEALRLQGKEQNGGVDDEAFVLPLLQDLAQKLAGRARNTGRRTQHGLARSEEGQRPTPRAYPDAGEAHDDAIWWDTEKGTVVVLGPRGRVHVFTPQGKHVTSVMMPGSAIDRRRHQGRWRLAEPDERGEFRIQLKRLVAAGEDKPADEGPVDGPIEGPGAPEV